jgi:hypothetical protein
MFRYRTDQSELLIPLSRDGLIHQPTRSSQEGSQILEENDWLNKIGHRTYELHDFTRYVDHLHFCQFSTDSFISLRSSGSARPDRESSRSSYAPCLPPERDLEHLKDKECHPWWKQALGRVKRQKRTWFFSGWRVGVTSNTCLTTVVLILNIVLTIWASLSFPMEGGFGTLIQGECDKVKSWALWLHLAINVLSTLLLSASNYTMQCLLAPTRSEVDKAHKKGKGVRIGVGGISNLEHIARNRAIIYALLVLSSVPLHLL